MAVRSKALTIRQGGLLDGAAEGSHHVHAVGLHSQLVAGEGLQRHQQQLLGRAANRMWCYNTGRVDLSTHDHSHVMKHKKSCRGKKNHAHLIFSLLF